MKIKIICNWASTEEVTRRVLSQFKTSESDVEGLEFVYDDSYEAIVILGYPNEMIKPGVKALVFPQEPTWAGGHPRTFAQNMKAFGYDKENYEQKDLITECVSHMFYGGVGPWQEGWEFWNYENIRTNPFPKTKNICAFISKRGVGDTFFPDGCIYGERIGLVENISISLPFVDFYGWNVPYSTHKGNSIKDYKFCISVENTHEKNYITEKFYDCILTNTIPIYYGCTNIKEYWPEEGYILLDSLSDYQSIIDKLNWINENSDEIYNRMLPELLKIKKRYFEEFNLLKKIRYEI